MYSKYCNLQVTLLLAWVFFYEFTGETEPKYYEKWSAFFFFVHLFGWLIIILLFNVFAFELNESLGGEKCWCMTVSDKIVRVLY